MTTGYKVDNRRNADLVVGQLGNFSWSEALGKFGSCGFEPALGVSAPGGRLTLAHVMGVEGW